MAFRSSSSRKSAAQDDGEQQIRVVYCICVASHFFSEIVKYSIQYKIYLLQYHYHYHYHHRYHHHYHYQLYIFTEVMVFSIIDAVQHILLQLFPGAGRAQTTEGLQHYLAGVRDRQGQVRLEVRDRQGQVRLGRVQNTQTSGGEQPNLT